MTDDLPGKNRPPRRRRTAPGRCPICGAATSQATRPFCSRRCADVDLGRWFSGAYRVPTDEAPGEAPDGAQGQVGDGASAEDDDLPHGNA